MNMETGRVYPSREAALAAGEDPTQIGQVKVTTIKNGPYKGRKYLTYPDGRLGRRVKELE